MTDYFDDYFFTSNVSDHTCPGFGSNVCKPPNACARDPNTGRRYCCDVKDVCWTLTETCANDGSTTDCGTGSTTWCCIYSREECTATKNQVNVCWSTHHDILNNITNKVLNDTYSSLSKAHPSATTWSFEPLALIAETAPPTSSATSSGDTSATSSAPSAAATATNGGHESSVIRKTTGGAIAGIVIGSIAGVALIAGIIFFLWRRARNKQAAAGSYQVPGSGPAPGGIPDSSGAAAMSGAASGLDDKPRYAGAPNFGANNDNSNNNNNNGYYANTPSPMPPSTAAVSELHGDNVPPPQELPASTTFGAIPSELSATSPSVPTAYAGSSSSNHGSPAPGNGAAEPASTDVSPELAYQRPYQATPAQQQSPPPVHQQ
ncbi:hypothetical protein SCUCBS95973_001644 [Sporothrix curviconia]|uniref:Mid2 domain-containing protein n=1 Tax=Sporothrix curviconia TaxID=1260050 RepID=A0ABP0B0A5_9PEZI